MVQNWNRFYDPAIGRYLEPEPLWNTGEAALDGAVDGLQWPAYGYAANDPINVVDVSGWKPGDHFPTADGAAKDATDYYSGPSAANNREYGGRLYKSHDIKNKDAPYFATPDNGKGAINKCSIPDCLGPTEAGGKCAGWYHTHGAKSKKYEDEKFSPDDKDISDSDPYGGLPGYLRTPRGKNLKYTPNGVPRGGAVSPY